MKKRSLLVLLSVLSVLAVSAVAQTNYGTITFTNKFGYVISNAVVTKVDADRLTYLVSGGGGIVRLADLPEALQARFGYGPERTNEVADVQRLAQPSETERKQFEETKAKAETGDAKAQYQLGQCYSSGKGVSTNFDE